jgi:hypothetical protein
MSLDYGSSRRVAIEDSFENCEKCEVNIAAGREVTEHGVRALEAD